MNYTEYALLFLVLLTIFTSIYLIGRYFGFIQIEKMCELIYRKIK